MSSYNQQPIITSTGSYFNLPYGTTTFSENENVNINSSVPNISQNLSNSNPAVLQPVISDNRNSTTYMQSNSQISTSTTHSAEMSKSKNEISKDCVISTVSCFRRRSTNKYITRFINICESIFNSTIQCRSSIWP